MAGEEFNEEDGQFEETVHEGSCDYAAPVFGEEAGEGG